jgi:archaellum component FlaD/FlaE
MQAVGGCLKVSWSTSFFLAILPSYIVVAVARGQAMGASAAGAPHMQDLYDEAARLQGQLRQGGPAIESPGEQRLDRMVEEARETNQAYQQTSQSIQSGAEQIGEIIANQMKENQADEGAADSGSAQSSSSDSSPPNTPGQPEASTSNVANTQTNDSGAAVVTAPAPVRAADPPLDPIAEGVLNDASPGLNLPAVTGNLWDDPSLTNLIGADPSVAIAPSTEDRLDLAAPAGSDDNPRSGQSSPDTFVQSLDTPASANEPTVATVGHEVTQRLVDGIMSQLKNGDAIDLQLAAKDATRHVVEESGADFLQETEDRAPSTLTTDYLSIKVILSWATVLINPKGVTNTYDQLIRQTVIAPLNQFNSNSSSTDPSNSPQ